MFIFSQLHQPHTNPNLSYTTSQHFPLGPSVKQPGPVIKNVPRVLRHKQQNPLSENKHDLIIMQ